MTGAQQVQQAHTVATVKKWFTGQRIPLLQHLLYSLGSGLRIISSYLAGGQHEEDLQAVD
jgi:hypothetical protein